MRTLKKIIFSFAIMTSFLLIPKMCGEYYDKSKIQLDKEGIRKNFFYNDGFWKEKFPGRSHYFFFKLSGTDKLIE